MAAPIPSLETERLRLRAPSPADLDALAVFLAGPDAAADDPAARGAAYTHLTALAAHWHTYGFGRWIVADRTSDAALGVVGPHRPADWPEPELAWSLFAGAEGRGLAEEAARAARAYARRNLGLGPLVSLIAPDNRRSAALAGRLGCRRDRTVSVGALGARDLWRHPIAPACEERIDP